MSTEKRRIALFKAARQCSKGGLVQADVKRVLECKHWYVPVKHRCGPATKVCQDCGHEVAL